MRARLGLWMILGISMLRLALAQTPQASTDEFVLGTAGSRFAEDPDIAATAAGFVTAWLEDDPTSTVKTIVGRRFNAEGTFEGDVFRVNADSSDSLTRAAIAARSDGRFAVSFENFGETSEIRARVFQPNARPLQLAAGLNTQTTLQQLVSDVAALSSGGWVVAWGDANTANRVVARLLDADGAISGAEIPVSTSVDFDGINVCVAASATGPFSVTWSSDGDDGNGIGIMARVFSATGSPLTAEFVVNDFTTGNQGGANVEALKDGTFLVVWSGPNAEGSHGISMQRFTATGARVGSQTVVSDSTSLSQIQPRVAALDDGGWMIVWEGFGLDDDAFGLVGRRFDKNGNAVGEQFAVNQITVGSQHLGGVAVLGNVFCVAWESDDGGFAADGVVVGRLFSLPSADTAPPFAKIKGDKRLVTSGTRAVVQGTANDESSLAAVLVSVNGSAFKRAMGVASWKVNVSLKKGANIIRVKAVDASGNESAPVVVRVERRSRN